MKDRIKRLEIILSKIISCERDQESFDELYDILKDECDLEGVINNTGTYFNNLRQTIQKQAESFIAMRNRGLKRGAHTEYKDFIDNFRLDVINELTYIKRNNMHNSQFKSNL